MDEIILLNRIRVDIGNVSGSLSDLLELAGMSGFNDNYEPQAKPRLVGTWTINDWYTSAQLAQAQAAFDGLTIVGDPNYVINFNDLAVQTLDSTEPHYNPAVAIILQAKGKGTTLDVPLLGQGRYMLTKSQASSITSIGTWFSGVKNPYDSNGIVSSDTTMQYSFNDFIELKYFTGVSTLSGAVFQNCSNLTRLGISKNLVNFGDRDGSVGSMNLFTGCTSLNAVYYYGSVNDWFKINFYCINTGNLHSNPLIFAKHLYINDEILEHIVIDDLNITSLKKMVFMNNVDVKSITVNSPITDIGYAAFSGCTNLESIQINNEDVNRRLINIGGLSFMSCTLLNSIVFNNVSPKSISTAAFDGVPYKFTNNDLAYLETYGSGLANSSTISNWDDYITLPSIVTFYTKYGGFGSTPLMLTLGENLTSFILQRYVDRKFHLLCSTPPSVGSTASVQVGAKIYVGDGSSAAHDNAILSTYASTAGYWQDLYNANGLDTWYNYLHPAS